MYVHIKLRELLEGPPYKRIKIRLNYNIIRKNKCECFKNKINGIISSQAIIEILGKGSETRNEAKDF